MKTYELYRVIRWVIVGLGLAAITPLPMMWVQGIWFPGQVLGLVFASMCGGLAWWVTGIESWVRELDARTHHSGTIRQCSDVEGDR